MLEDAIPINVSQGQTKSAREVFTIIDSKLRDKGELTKEEKHRERAHRKRKIKSHLKHKADHKKDERRAMGMAQTDRFEMKDVKRKMDKKKTKEDGGAAVGDKDPKSSKNEMKSSKFFKRLQEVVKDDKDKKDSKKRAKTERGGKEPMIPLHNHTSAKKFKL